MTAYTLDQTENECPECGVLVFAPERHQLWHDRLRSDIEDARSVGATALDEIEALRVRLRGYEA